MKRTKKSRSYPDVLRRAREAESLVERLQDENKILKDNNYALRVKMELAMERGRRIEKDFIKDALIEYLELDERYKFRD